MSFKAAMLALLLLGVAFSIDVDSCAPITSPGEYVLIQDLTGVNDTNLYCIRVEAENVSLDCDGHSLTGSGSGAGDSGIDIKIGSANDNVTIKNCNVSNYDYGISGDPTVGNILNNTLYNNGIHGLFLIEAQGLRIADNKIYENGFGPLDGDDGCDIEVDDSLIESNQFYGNGYAGLYVSGDSNNITDNVAYNNVESGFRVSGEDIGGVNNRIIGNTAYGNDLESFEGGGFEIIGVNNTVDDNIAYNNTNGIYIEGVFPAAPASRGNTLSGSTFTGPYGNTVTNNHAYNNVIGINILDYNGTVTDNTIEENLAVDLMVGGDAWFNVLGGLLRASGPENPEDICNNRIEDNTGSGGRDIFYSNSTANLNGVTYSEVLLCNAPESTLTKVTVSGSNTLDNNGVLLMFSDDSTIESSNSKNNFMGFGVYDSPEVTISNSNSDGSGIGAFMVASRGSAIDRLSALNTKMDGDILLTLLMGILGGDSILGSEDTLRAPEIELAPMGIGALIRSNDVVITDSTFSGGTLGVVLITSQNAVIQGGSSHDNDFLAYGLVDSYNVTIDGASAYNNKGSLNDLFGEETPIEGLGIIPLGLGVADISIDVIADMFDGDDASASMRAPTVQTNNTYRNMRIYNNNYGMLFLNKGREVVDSCRIYDNSIFGIADASNPNVIAHMGTSSVTTTPSVIYVSNSYLARNGEGIFSTMEERFEEEGDMEEMATLFRLLNQDIQPGVLEIELVEASYLYQLIDRVGASSELNWQVHNTNIGDRGLEVSLDDNATAVYILSDTTLPNQRFIHLEDEDLGLDQTIHFGFEGVDGKRSTNQYFLVGAIKEGDVAPPPPPPPVIGSDTARADTESPSISTFQVHYGGGYDSETMGLYYLKFRNPQNYCEADGDCADLGPEYACYENGCVHVDCTVDSNCTDHLGRPSNYCVGYQCVGCREDADCSESGSCSACLDGSCTASPCIADSECDSAEGCLCDYETAECSTPFVVVIGNEDYSPALPEQLRGEVVLRAPTLGNDIILKGRWMPVPRQSNNVSTRTITVTDFEQTDRTPFLESMIGGDSIGVNIYSDVYGLFGVPLQGGDGEEPVNRTCYVDADCGPCDFCSIDNNMCLPREASECGTGQRECNGAGYTCEQCSCVPPECTTDSQCISRYGENYECSDYVCVENPPEEKPPEEQPPTGEEGGQTGETGTAPPSEEVVPPEQPTEEPAYPLVEVEVPSVQAPQQPVSEGQVQFQTQQIGLVLLLLIGLVAAYIFFKSKKKKGK